MNDSAAPAIFDLRDVGGTSDVTGNKINLSGTFNGGVTPFGTGATVAYAIQAQGNITNLSLVNNVLNGGNVGGAGGSGTPPTSGILLLSALSRSSQLSITGNRITGFVDGVDAQPLLKTTSIVAHMNCIFHNSSFGANNDTATSSATLTADNNWWGAISGPHNPSTNAGGTGNAVSDNIVYKPFLTAAPTAACAGPIVTNLKLTPNPANTGQNYVITATASDATTGNFTIASATYTVDGGAAHAMAASDGTFDQVTENVTANGAGFADPGTHTICVTAVDAAGLISAPVCTTLTVQNPAGQGGVSNPPNVQTAHSNGAGGSGSTSGNASSGGNASSASTTSGVGATTGSATMSSQSSPSSSFPTGLLLGLLGGIVLLGGAGGAALALQRRRSAR